MSANVNITYDYSDESREITDDEEVSTVPQNGNSKSESDPSNTDSEPESKGPSTNQSLANVMAKILNKRVTGKNVVLAKGTTDRKLSDRKRKKVNSVKKEDFEVVGDVKSELQQIEQPASSDEDIDPEILREKRIKKKRWEDMGRVAPQVLDQDKERSLQKIATRGVVQLFNAVKKQQKSIEEKLSDAGPSERRKEQVLKSMTKGQFLDVLKGTAPASLGDKKLASKVSDHSNGKDTKSEKSATFLREDFMMGSEMKDWNNDSESSDGSENLQEMDSESDT